MENNSYWSKKVNIKTTYTSTNTSTINKTTNKSNTNKSNKNINRPPPIITNYKLLTY